MASNRRTSTTEVEQRSSEAFLKGKVKELEDEVTRLRKRLDDLRRAKNTTVHKREREVIHVGVPFGRRESKSEMKKDGAVDPAKEIDELRKQFAKELEIVKTQNAQDSKCDHEAELACLRVELSEAEGENAALRVENQELRERVDTLATELSVKEAGWCDREEKLKLQLQQSWGEKYKAWMESTEAKIMELQQTNALLRGYLKKQKPGGSDPSGEDQEQ
ncbi:uncharacterized protein LOC124279216 [Haliotis rubra]|uniref:uncharacterized protein LOC124279216 n=1 Tax=Haliotis rubra TaxID=36100 RepID=UPI001EE59447|nr:uncharacterized protein LOC124279216 [Haliotis rubra]XP_046570979.1 uncharacterized protein LOC124279216 [Haliotis rubra]